MVVKTAPPAPFIIAEAEFLLELLIVALDPPSQLGEIDQTLKADLLRQCGKPIFGRLSFASLPLDQQPLFGVAARSARYRDVPAARAFGRSAISAMGSNAGSRFSR